MGNSVIEFIEWWASMSQGERRQRIAEAKERKTHWMARRASVLFGLLEEDATEDTLDQLPFTVRNLNGNRILGRFKSHPDAALFVDAWVAKSATLRGGGIAFIEETM